MSILTRTRTRKRTRTKTRTRKRKRKRKRKGKRKRKRKRKRTVSDMEWRWLSPVDLVCRSPEGSSQLEDRSRLDHQLGRRDRAGRKYHMKDT